MLYHSHPKLFGFFFMCLFLFFQILGYCFYIINIIFEIISDTQLQDLINNVFNIFIRACIRYFFNNIEFMLLYIFFLRHFSYFYSIKCAQTQNLLKYLLSFNEYHIYLI